MTFRLIGAVLSPCSLSLAALAGDLPLGAIRLPEGFSIEILARVPNARQMVAGDGFATGWLQGESAWGRPADVLELPDGSLLVSGDLAGAIYRITHSQARRP